MTKTDDTAPAPQVNPDYWAIHSATGIHIGLWPDKADADEVLREYEGGTITPLYRNHAPDPQARPLSEWHEEYGFVTWWKFPVNEPSYIGSPLCDDWPGYHTHWTPHPVIPANAGDIAATEGSDNG